MFFLCGVFLLFGVCRISAQSVYLPYAVGTIAGVSGEGYLDGTLDIAKFSSPGGVAIDISGNVYVADTKNNTVRRMTPDGIITTLAGTAGTPGALDGTNCAALFFGPSAIAVDTRTNLYIADTANCTVRKISPMVVGGKTDWVVTTLAGTAGLAGSRDGVGSDAQFNVPAGISVDLYTNIYVADTGNHTIRKLSRSVSGGKTNWVVSTLAGLAGVSGATDGIGQTARFNSPRGLVGYGQGAVFVADCFNHTIRKVSQGGEVTTFAGSALQPGSSDGLPTKDARFCFPRAVAVDSKFCLYVADSGNHTVRRISWGNWPGQVNTLAGLSEAVGNEDGIGSAAQFDSPVGLAIGRQGNLIISDAVSHRIRAAAPANTLQVVVQPLGRSMRLGSQVTLEVSVLGTPPFTFKWFKNEGSDGKPVLETARIQGSATSSLTISSFAVTNAGYYFVRVTNAFGWTQSALAKLNLDALNPTVTVSAPTSGVRVTSNTVSIIGRASDNAGVIGLVITNLNGSPVSVSGLTNWSASAPLIPGTNWFDVFAWDAAGNYSKTNRLNVFYVVTAPVVVQTNGIGAISPNYDGKMLEIGKNYSITATPGAGYLFSNWTGGVVANTPKLEFSMQSNLVLKANFVPNPFIALKGGYNGLFCSSNGVSFADAGFLSATITDKGAYSGRVLLAGNTNSFSGQLSVAGTGSNYLTRVGSPALRVYMQLDFADGALRGTVGDGNWISELYAIHATNRASAAKYTVVLPGDGGASTAPGGEGFGTVILSATNMLQLTGTLADGTKLSQSLTLGSTGQWPLYASLYSGKGLIFGWVQFTNAQSEDLRGEVDWIKLAQAAFKSYTNGFHLRSELIGSKYVAPTNGQRVISISNGVISFENGRLQEPFTNNVLIATNSRVVNLSSNKLSLTNVLGSGVFNGTVTPPGTTRTISFSGAYLQKRNSGHGFFVDTNQTGRVYLGQ